MGLNKDFEMAIKESIQYNTEHLNAERKDGKYYENEYADLIKDYFDNHNPKIESYEANYSSRYKCTPICAFASSGRLCYLFFRPKGATFETPLYNDLKQSAPTKMDAVLGTTNYECKCQEILSTSHEPLREAYLESELFKEFGVKNIQRKQVIKKNKRTGKVEKYNVLMFNTDQLNIHLPKEIDYSKLHFDLKQLICHLIALANNNGGKSVKLEYVFFTPNKDIILKYKTVKKLYETLKQEITAIFSNKSSITKFALKHNISIGLPKYVEIGTIDDFNYKEKYLR